MLPYDEINILQPANFVSGNEIVWKINSALSKSLLSLMHRRNNWDIKEISFAIFLSLLLPPIFSWKLYKHEQGRSTKWVMKFQGGRWCARVNEEQRRAGREKRTRETADERKRTGWAWGRKWEWETSHERFTSSGTDRGTPAASDTWERERERESNWSFKNKPMFMHEQKPHMHMTTYNILDWRRMLFWSSVTLNLWICNWTGDDKTSGNKQMNPSSLSLHLSVSLSIPPSFICCKNSDITSWISK